MRGGKADAGTLALAVYALRRCDFRFGKFVFLTGWEEPALLCGEIALHCGAAAVVIRAAGEAQRREAQARGFVPFDPVSEDVGQMLERVTQGRKFDLLIETTGEPDAYDLLLQVVKKGGCAALMKAPEQPYFFHVCDVIRDQIHFMGIISYDARSEEIARRALESSGALAERGKQP